MSKNKIKRRATQEFLLTLFDSKNGDINEIKEMNGFILFKQWVPEFKHWSVNVFRNAKELKDAVAVFNENHENKK